MIKAHDAHQKAQLRSINAMNASFWSQPEAQGRS
jgi:hypothetical protein